MQITPELRRVLESIGPGFFGSVEIGVQNGVPGNAKVTTTYKLSGRENRTENGNSTSRSTPER